MNFGPLSTPWLQVGRGTYCSPDIALRTWMRRERIIIGNYCSIGERVSILTGGMRRTDTAALYPLNAAAAYRSTKDTTIGNDVWIGYSSIIARGAQVGDGAVIAVGSVVFSDVPSFAVVAGNPAQVIRYRFSEDLVKRLLRIAWWHWPDAKILSNIVWFYRPIAEFVDHFDRKTEASGE